MQVFELYIRRLAKRKILLGSMIMLPVLFAVLLASLYEPYANMEYVDMLNSMVGILMILTLMNSMLFYGDKQHMTAQRVLLSIHSKFSYYCQMVAVFLTISAVQLVAMEICSGVLLPGGFPLSLMENIIFFLAYGLFNIIAAGVGLLVMNQSRSKHGGGLKLTAIVCLLVLLSGMFWAGGEPPAFFKHAAAVLPTYWLTKVISILLDGVSRNMTQLLMYMTCLTLCASFIMLMLSRTKTENI
ncbi:ABC transporter permease [Paenibacillus septentrionalis]|uniref:ABC transporter permease n=1 Tax=Paenibacillus septentrionalis TaxID=429342 RepID=A0ABW1V5W3_9BACL